LRELGLRNIRSKHSDGSTGWPEYAPYDGIIVTAAPPEIPADLFVQLAVGGRMVIPVGNQGRQQLSVITRQTDGFEQEDLEAVSFVPMLAGGG